MKPACLAVPLTLAVLLLGPSVTFAQELKPIQLLQPHTDSGRPLMQVLKDRASSRSFSSEKLPVQILANMLWAAFGLNGPEYIRLGWSRRPPCAQVGG
jgi:hypothetical protein